MAVVPTLQHAPPSPDHTLTVPSTPWCDRDDDQRGARFRARINRATTLYSVGPRTRTMMQPCASAAKLRGGGPILPLGMTAMSHLGTPPPRTVIGDPSRADGLGRNCQVSSATSVHCAGRSTTPSGTTPSRTSRHRAIRSLRAKATIMVLRVPRAVSVRARNHCANALFF